HGATETQYSSLRYKTIPSLSLSIPSLHRLRNFRNRVGAQIREGQRSCHRKDQRRRTWRRPRKEPTSPSYGRSRQDGSLSPPPTRGPQSAVSLPPCMRRDKREL